MLTLGQGPRSLLVTTITSGLINVKFYMEPLMRRGIESLFDLVTSPRWPPCPYMVNLKTFLLQNQTTDNL